MNKILSNAVLGLALASGWSAVQAQAVDTSVDRIFNAVAETKDLQASVDQLLAQGAKPQEIVAVAAAAGISADAVKSLQVCVNSVSDNARVLGASCLKQSSLMTAYATGLNDPMQYLPATAAGKHARAGAATAGAATK